MSRRSSNRVVEQQSSSSNTTAPTDTPSGMSHTHRHTRTSTLICNYTSVAFLLVLVLFCFLYRQQPPNEETEPGCTQDSEVPAPMPPQVRHNTLFTNLSHRTKVKQGHTAIAHYLTHVAHWHLCPHHTGANSWCCFTVPAKPLDGP